MLELQDNAVATDDAIAGLVGYLLHPSQFFVAASLRFVWCADVVEAIPWELFHGRLLEPRQTRRTRTFRSWTVTQETGGVPAESAWLALRWDTAERTIYVTRGLLCHAWEAYDEGSNVILSREATRWTTELVGRVIVGPNATIADLHEELVSLLRLALVGTSRLPLTSLEAPLPAFTLGQAHYVPGPRNREEPMQSWRELVRRAGWQTLDHRAQAKLVEFVLRASTAEETADLAEALSSTAIRDDARRVWKRVLRLIFNEVSLSPYTQFVDTALGLVATLVERGTWTAADEVDFLGWLLRQLGRHLTAYDLVVFHHRGANYPDALLLDAVWSRLLERAERTPELLAGDRREHIERRRALRQGTLLRRAYEGHPVPDAPTSPGENARVLPETFPRVPEEQLLNPPKRSRRLFANDPATARLSATTRRLLAQACDDLHADAELAELGMAVFIDRPLGRGKEATEPDQTLLLAHEAFSAAIAARRLDQWEAFAAEADIRLPRGWLVELRRRLRDAAPAAGLPLELVADVGRPVAALADARRVSGDFVVTRTLPGSVRAFFATFDWRPIWRRFSLAELERDGPRWIVRMKVNRGDVLALVDAAMQPRVLFEADAAQGYQTRGGVEFPRAGLRVWHVRDDAGQVHDLTGQDVRVRAVA